MQETLEKQLEVKEKELQDIHDAKARLKNLRNIRVDDGNKVERDVAEIKSLLIQNEEKARQVKVDPLPGLNLTDISIIIPKEMAKINEQVVKL